MIKQIQSSDNLIGLFTQNLPTATFQKLVHNIRLRWLKDLLSWKSKALHTYEGSQLLSGLYSFSFFKVFPYGVSYNILMRQF